MRVKAIGIIWWSCVLMVCGEYASGQALTREFRGKILSKSDSLPIPFVNIYTEGYDKFTSSGASGSFSLEIIQGDTLNFSAVGFRPLSLKAYVVPGMEETIYLEQVTYELPGLTIYGKNAMEGFFDHNRLYNPETEKTFEQKFPKPSVGFTGAGVGVTGLLTLLANQFNSEYKQLKKLREIEKDEYKYFRRLELIYSRLSPDYIVENTSLKREEVEDFIAFWHPTLHFMETADGYQLLTKVQEKETQYIEQLKQDNQGQGVVSTIELRKLLEDEGNE